MDTSRLRTVNDLARATGWAQAFLLEHAGCGVVPFAAAAPASAQAIGAAA